MYNKHLAEYEASFAEVKKEDLGNNGPKWTYAVAQAIADGLVAVFKLRLQVIDDGREAGEEVDSTEARALAEKGDFSLPVHSNITNATSSIQALSRSINLIDDLSVAEKVRASKSAQYEKVLRFVHILFSAWSHLSHFSVSCTTARLGPRRSRLSYDEADADLTNAEERLKQARGEQEFEKKAQK